MPEALLFAFDAVKTDTAAGTAALIIEEVPVGGRCHACHREFQVEEKYVFSCPTCGSQSFTVHAGRELDITEMEVL